MICQDVVREDFVLSISNTYRPSLADDLRYKHDRGRCIRFWIHWLRDVTQAKPVLSKQGDPTCHCAKVPGRRVGEVVAKSGPAPRAPAVYVGFIATNRHRVQGLDNQGTTGMQECGDLLKQVLNGFITQ